MSDNNLSKNGVLQESHHEEQPSIPVAYQSDTKGPQDLEDPEWHLDYKIILTFLIMMIQYNASYFTLTLSAPIATYINADLGPKPYYVWMTIVWPLAFAATITIDGRLGDLFGRRWLMIGGNILCVVASIIGGTAQSIGVVILAIGLNGMAGAIQQTASAAVSEIVPRKYRPQAASTVAGSGIIGGAFGTPIAIHLATTLSWRWGFWIPLLTAGISVVGLACYYFPPTFEEVHNKDRRTKWQEFKDFDFIGAILFIGGITVLLLGISWGGITYPWKSAGVIVPLIIGALALVAFGFWEVYGNLKESLVPYKLFKNVRGFTMVLVADFVGGMLLYALISLYPVQIATVYESNPAVAAWESCTLLMGTFVSIILMGNILGRIGHARLIFAVSVGLNTIFLGCMAAMTPSTLGAALALTTLTGFTIGFVQLVGIVMIMLNCPDEDIGLAVGLNGSARTIGGSIATAMYSTVLSNKVQEVLPGNIAAAVLPLGLPISSIGPLIVAFLSGSTAAIEQVPGITLPVIGAAAQAVKESYAQGFRLVYLVSISFGVVATVCAACTTDIDHLLTNDVAAKLHAPELLPRHRNTVNSSDADVEANQVVEKA